MSPSDDEASLGVEGCEGAGEELAYAAAFVGERCCGAVCFGAGLREDLGGLGFGGGAALPCLDAALLGLGACLRDDVGGLAFCLVAPLLGLGGCEREDCGGLAVGLRATLGGDRLDDAVGGGMGLDQDLLRLFLDLGASLLRLGERCLLAFRFGVNEGCEVACLGQGA